MEHKHAEGQLELDVFDAASFDAVADLGRHHYKTEEQSSFYQKEKEIRTVQTLQNPIYFISIIIKSNT